MAKITLSEAVHVSITIEGNAVELDLTVGDNDVEQNVADLLIGQGLAVESSSKTSTKKTSSTPIVEETPTTESTEAN